MRRQKLTTNLVDQSLMAYMPLNEVLKLDKLFLCYCSKAVLSISTCRPWFTKKKTSQSNTDADTCEKAAVTGICGVKREKMTSSLLKQLKSLTVSL